MLAKLLKPLVDILFPPRCPLCGTGTLTAASLCPECWALLAIPGEPCCGLCQRPFSDSTADGTICAPCLHKPPRHDGIAAGTIYNEASRKLVLSLKHGHRIALAPMMARIIATRLKLKEGEWLFVPVPLHRRRLWRRGFNQSALLAASLARMPGGQLCVDALHRHRHTPSLGGLGRKARARALSGAISLNARRRDRIVGARIVLVDDVMTSGATTDACVSVLKRSGARCVMIACFARVIDDAPQQGNWPADAETPGG